MRKDKVIRLRCTEEEAARWQESASKGNLLLSEWVRNRLNEAAAGEVIRVDAAQRVNSLIGRTFYPVEPKSVATKKPVATPSRAVCSHKPFKRSDGLTVCEKCGVRL